MSEWRFRLVTIHAWHLVVCETEVFSTPEFLGVLNLTSFGLFLIKKDQSPNLCGLTHVSAALDL